MQTFSCILSNTINPLPSFTEIREITVDSLSSKKQKCPTCSTAIDISLNYNSQTTGFTVKSSLLFPHSFPCKDSLNCQAGILAKAAAQERQRELTNTQILVCSYNMLGNISWPDWFAVYAQEERIETWLVWKHIVITYCIINGKNYSYYFQYFYASFFLSRLGETVYIYSNQERGGREISSPTHFFLKPCITTFTIASILQLIFIAIWLKPH